MKQLSHLAFALILGLAFGCGKKDDCCPNCEQNEKKPVAAAHHHDPPHGGTAVTLGDEEGHLEFVRDAATGKLTAYLLKPHMTGFWRTSATQFEVAAKVGDKTETLVFKAVANAATGETIGDTAQFEAQADWLKTTERFDGTLTELNLNLPGKTFKAVAFNFPKGN